MGRKENAERKTKIVNSVGERFGTTLLLCGLWNCGYGKACALVVCCQRVWCGRVFIPTIPNMNKFTEIETNTELMCGTGEAESNAVSHSSSYDHASSASS